MVAAAILGGQRLELLPNTQTTNNSDECRWVATDHKHDDNDVLDRVPQRGIAVCEGGAQNAWRHQRIAQEAI